MQTRQLYRAQSSVSVGLSDTLLLPDNPRRIALIISAPATNRVTLSFNGPATLDAGITLYPAASPLILHMEHIGQSVREEIHAIAAVGAQTIGVLDISEIDCPCQTGG